MAPTSVGLPWGVTRWGFRGWAVENPTWYKRLRIAAVRSRGIAMDTTTYVRPSRQAALDLARATDLPGLMRRAAGLRDAGFGRPVSYSRKVFIPLTKLCRGRVPLLHVRPAAAAGRAGVHDPRRGARRGSPRRRGRLSGGAVTLGDKPELRYPQAGAELDALGYPTTIAYLVAATRAVWDATGLLPHANRVS